MSHPEPAPSTPRESFGSRMGFVMAAVGSAVGLGNMWRFPYAASEGGGAAFVLAYVFMVFLIGVPIILAEFAMGRRSRRSAIGAVRAMGGRLWTPLGVLFVITSLMVLAFISVITGWVIRYALDGLLFGFSATPGERYADVSTGGLAIVYHLIAVGATVGIVTFGVRRGIERASLILMPILFVLLIGLAVWAATLPNAAAGYRFYLSPSFADVLDPVVLQGAASQAFLSLSVGMGIMITYSSYVSRDQNLGREAVIIALSDFSVAFVAGLVVFPVVFALGLSEEVGESTLGVLFISLPSAFARMEGVGRAVGSAFFITLIVAALTSAVSLLEVVASVGIDQLGMTRRRATLIAGALAAALGLGPALSQSWLGIMDQLAAELFTVLGVLGVAVLVGWAMKNPEGELLEGASPTFARLARVPIFLVRWVAPVVLGLIAWIAVRETIAVLSGSG